MKTNRIFTALAALALAGTFFACKPDEKTPEASFSVNPTTISAKADGESVTISVTSNVAWSASSPSWITVSPASGKENAQLTVSVSKNASTDPRNSEITFTYDGSKTVKVAVSQEGGAAAPTLSVDKKTVSFSDAGGNETVALSTNQAWTATSSESWLTVSPASGSNNGSLTLTAAANTGAKRTASVTIAAGTLSETISVSQAEHVEVPSEAPVADILDVVFNDDGTATNKAASGLEITTVPGDLLAVAKSDKYGFNVASFDPGEKGIGGTTTAGYYYADYETNDAIKGKLADGHTFEILVMADFAFEDIPQSSGTNKEVKPLSTMQAGGTGFLISKGTSGGAGTFCWLPYVDGGYHYATTGIKLEKGVFYHVVGVYDKDAAKARCYLNGSLTAEVDAAGDYGQPSAKAFKFVIGGDPDTKGQCTASWKGVIAIARIYDKALTAGEVAALYNKVK